ncbi:MAG: sugar transferase [Thermodesulfobacteriota bacterium]
MEKLRTDRSKAPLSIALFYFPQGKRSLSNPVRSFLTSVCKKTREIDIKGWIDQDVFALLLPDTDQKGVQSCMERITNGYGEVTRSVVTGTYPNDLFHKILTEEKGQPDLFPLFPEESVEVSKFQRALKRGMDIVGCLVGILLFLPLMFLTAIAVKITSPGPIVFRQSRLGKKGTRFSFYKFRSMVMNGDDHIHRDYVANLIQGNLEKVGQEDQGILLYKIKSDPRITRVGRIIRKFSIDELPQLFNVLRGEMSLVGPRPPVIYEVEKYEPWHLRRILDVKPGMTGLWQVDGRSKTPFQEMVRLDLRYAQNWSIWLDLKILIKTVRAVLCPSGAL